MRTETTDALENSGSKGYGMKALETKEREEAERLSGRGTDVPRTRACGLPRYRVHSGFV